MTKDQIRSEWQHLIYCCRTSYTARESALSSACSVRTFSPRLKRLFCKYMHISIIAQIGLERYFLLQEVKIINKYLLFPRRNILHLIRDGRSKQHKNLLSRKFHTNSYFFQSFLDIWFYIGCTGYLERKDSWCYLKHVGSTFKIYVANI